MNKINFYTDDVKSITIEYGNGTIKKYSYTKSTQEPTIETIAEGDNSGSGTIEVNPEDENSQIAPPPASPENNNPNQDENNEDAPDKNGDEEEENEKEGN